ncbi:MAG: hypothetical protein RML84_11355 [Anaerolineae bacterium]|nr:hypothetical protein [Anaerolineae bacterium]
MRWIIRATALVLALTIASMQMNEPPAPTPCPAPPVVTARWIEPQRIEVCSGRAGDLVRFVPIGGALIGAHPGGCIVFPPSDALIDIRYAPAPGDRWCVSNGVGCGYGCSAPLSLLRYRVMLPMIAR